MVTGKKRQYPLPDNMEISLVTARSQVDSNSIGKIRFFPDGTSTGGRITLTQGERKYLVDINWLTGQVAILD
jgi:general secretion pathway protein H